MIRLIPNPTFERQVRLTVPDLAEPVEIGMTFRHMQQAAAAKWFAAALDRPSSEAIGDIVCGWSGVLGEDGKEIVFSAEALAQLLANYAPAASEIVRAWQLGLTESRVKN